MRAVEILAGAVVGLAEYALLRLRVAGRFRKRHPRWAAHWRALSRSERRALRRAIRRGGEIEARHARAVLDGIRGTIALRRAGKLRPKNLRNFRRKFAYWCVACPAAAAAAYLVEDPFVSGALAVAAGYFAFYLGLGVYALRSEKRWHEKWDPRFDAASRRARAALD